MANELKHGSVGTELTQAEWEGIGTHVFSSQATGDLAYASSATQLSRLGISGTATHILSISGGVPVWAAPASAAAGSLTGATLASGVTASSLTSLGTIATGTWQGTDVGVAYGGTGVSTLAANSLLTGNGTSAIVAEANLTFSGTQLQVNVDTGSIATPDASTGLTLVNSSAPGDGVQLSLISGTAGYGQIWFGDVNDENRGRFYYSQDTDTFGWNTATVGSMELNRTGLTINQGAADDEILAFKSSDVSHPFTAKAELDTYATFGKVRATGGLNIVAYQDTGSDSGAMIVRAYNQDAADTGKTTSDYGLIRLLTAVSDGSDDIAAVGTNGNLVSFDNLNTTRFIFDAEGSGHADIEWTTYATHDDLALVTDMEQELLLHEDEAKTERRHMLEEIGIIGEDSWHMENGKPRAMVNMTKLSMLHHGALMQAADKIKTLESRLLAIEGAS